MLTLAVKIGRNKEKRMSPQNNRNTSLSDEQSDDEINNDDLKSQLELEKFTRHTLDVIHSDTRNVKVRDRNMKS